MTKKNSAQRKIIQALKSAPLSREDLIHIIQSSGKWAVWRKGASRASKVYASKEAALEGARAIAKGRIILIHNKDGTIQSIKRATS